MRSLRLDDLLVLADDLGVPRLHPLGLVDSAVDRQHPSLGRGRTRRPPRNAAVLLESIVRNQLLLDGDWRLD